MNKSEFLKERYNIIISSQTDARKRTHVFSVTKRVVFFVSCIFVTTILISTGIIIGSQCKAQHIRIQIAQHKNTLEEKSSQILCCSLDEANDFASLSLISTFDNSTAKQSSNTDYSLNDETEYETKEEEDRYTSVGSENISMPRAEFINENTFEQLINIDMIDAIKIVDSQFQDNINNKVAATLENEVYDEVNIVYEGDFEGDSDKVNNWADVLSIYLSRTMYDDQKLLTIPSDRIELLSEVYNSMNEIIVNVVKEPYTKENALGSQDSPIITVNVTINSLTYMEGAELYSLDRKQKGKLEQLMSPDYYIYFSELLGVDVYSGMDYEEVRQVIDNLPDTTGGDVVRAALIRLGSPYSRSKRGSGDYVDCSYFAWWVYNQVGISIPTSSVMQAKYCYDNEFGVKAEDLQPGDLIFWTKKSCHCGRWHEIHHVGIYISDNTIIEASSGKGCVSIRPLWGIDGKTWKIFMYARPE